MSTVLRIIVCSISLWALCASAHELRAQTGPPGQGEKGSVSERQDGESAPAVEKKRRGGRRQWESLPEGRRKGLLERFERFKGLPPEKQDELRKRHEQLVRIRERIESEFQEEIGKLPPEERRRFVDERVRLALHELKNRIKKKEVVREAPPPESKEFAPETRRALNGRNDRLAEDLLGELIRDGVVDSDAAGRIRSLSREERIATILELHQQRFLRTLEESVPHVPPEELERFRKMPPRRFHGEIMRQRREQGLFGAFAQLCDLTPEQKETLRGITDEVEIERKKRRYFQANLRRRLLEMGVSREAVDSLSSMPLHRRVEEIHKLLQETPPDRIPSELRESMDEHRRRREGARRGGMRPPPGKDSEMNGGRPRGGRESRGRERGGARSQDGLFFHAPRPLR
jgi:hypothetical protein